MDALFLFRFPFVMCIVLGEVSQTENGKRKTNDTLS